MIVRVKDLIDKDVKHEFADCPIEAIEFMQLMQEILEEYVKEVNRLYDLLNEEEAKNKMNTEMKELECPRCGGNNLHHIYVTVWDREEDAKYTRLTSVANGNVKQSEELSEVVNPSLRRDAITIYFDCENCGDGLALSIIQHKGTTYTEWDMGKASRQGKD